MRDKNSTLSPQVIKAVERISRTNRLLVASDFDGTISDFTVEPEKATLSPLALTALRKLSEMPNTYVAIISGRALHDLSQKTAPLDRVRLVGSHGHEFDVDEVDELTPRQREALKQAKTAILGAVKKSKGSRLEVKPHGAAFHYRGMKKEPKRHIASLVKDLKKLKTGRIRHGKKVIEYTPVSTNKGTALKKIIGQYGVNAALFMGDDFTDEAAFKVLGKHDLSLKIGQGETAAKLRVRSRAEAEKVLALIAERRAEWLASSGDCEINRHLFLSDLRTVALIDSSCSINWLCVPRIDSAPLFGSLVGGPGAGHFKIEADGRPRQRYRKKTLIGITDFGGIKVTDFLDCSNGRTYQRAGRSDLVRLIEGSGKVRIEFAPKFNFGRVPTRLTKIKEGLRVEIGQHLIILRSPRCKWQISREGAHDVARCELKLKNERLGLVLLIGTASGDGQSASVEDLLSDSEAFWSGWCRSLKLPPLESELVCHSALVLRGLCYGPSGSFAAAATTSLPETIGGERNWDYRYCWPRDSSYTASALVRIGAPGPAMRLLDWLLELILDNPEGGFLAPLYSVTGRSITGEAEVPEAIGYLGSRPVRIGNLASEQLQLDTLGPVAELMLKLAEAGAALTSEHLELAEYLVKLVASRWEEPDSGIWEIRGAQRHYVHSKLMCWYTVECCSKVAAYLGLEKPEWVKLSKNIRQQIEKRGFDKKLNSYIAAYGLSEADAALLWIILSGFHEPDDPRCLGTLEFIEKELYINKALYRYRFDDTLHGHEGEFIICRTWMIEALALCGKKAKAKKLFSELLDRQGPLGLYSEQWDSTKNLALGNYPQAYSHLGLVNAACALSGVFQVKLKDAA